MSAQEDRLTLIERDYATLRDAVAAYGDAVCKAGLAPGEWHDVRDQIAALAAHHQGAVSLLREAHGWVDAAGEDLCRPEAEELAARIAAFLAIPGGQ